MSFKRGVVYPCNPGTARGEPTKLSSSKNKVVYTNGRTVIIRDLKDTAHTVSYSGHVYNATVARISPSGYYCASADMNGTVRIWDTVGEDQSLKGEFKALLGRIQDLDWDGESKRVIAVGDGRDKFGHAFMIDSGSSTGEIIGHSKTVNSVSIRQQRPYRAAAASDDGTITFHQGAPYKYDKTIKTHTKFVQDVRYAPSGDIFASVGTDAKIFLYDGKTGDTLAEVTDSPHSGSIFACSWGSDSKSFVTSSADCTVKLWDVETRKATITWTLGTGVSHQQVGNTWTEGDDIVSLSMSGDLNIFDKRVRDKPARVLVAPQKAITAAVPILSEEKTFLVGTADGRTLSFSGDEYSYVEGQGHSSLVSGLAPERDGTVFSIGFDDHLRQIDVRTKSFIPASCPTAHQPRAIAVGTDETVFVVEADDTVEVFQHNQKVFEMRETPGVVPSVIAAHGNLVAIGGENQQVHLWHWDGKTLTEECFLVGNRATISAVAFSRDGKYLASADANGKIVLYDVAERMLLTTRWSFHNARVSSMSWTADAKHCATGSLDTHVYVYSVDKPMRNIAIKNAAPGGVSSVFWLGDNVLASAGTDGCVRTWHITFHQ
ncbi:WD40 repeat-like protein [Obba rivulosa]|uniref:WD40 repeat-like protein n=1 Tax=Obba rivulosa TaxID=1052685 RepID=A0A8E2ANG0_9APHY|nr:WD40 repeat-like protein [Obba rivulosa]